MNNLVSVLIPAYNHEKYVQEAIKSIINQTYQNIELIVVDDGSKDSTWQKIQEMKNECEKRFVRVHFETKGNEGTCKTFNRLLDLSKGEFVYFIASDDVAKPEAIETEVKFLSKHKDYALVVGDNEIIDSNGNVVFWSEYGKIAKNKEEAKFKTFVQCFKHYRRDIKLNSLDFGSYQSLMSGNYIPNGYLIRKSIFRKIGYFTPEAPLEDYWLMLQISKYSKMKYIDKIFFSYRWHSDNTASQRKKMIDMTEKTMRYEYYILDNINPEEVLHGVNECKKDGIISKKKGIPYIFEIIKYKKRNNFVKVIKLFNFKILSFKS